VYEAGLSFECTLDDLREMKNEAGKVTATMALLKVVRIHINRDVYDEENGTIIMEKLDPVSRLGGNTYSLSRQMFDMARPGNAGAERKKALAGLAQTKSS